jgi:PEP-CTERM motif
VLNLPSYSGDFNASHIVSLTLSDSLSGTYNVDLATDIYASGSIMAWGPTGISELVLGLSKGAPASSWFLIADQNNDYGFNPFYPASIREFGIAGGNWGAWVSVPEPSTFALDGLGLAALLLILRRR